MSGGGDVLFTVFTPTYNRARTLPRVYESLCAQTETRFEWLVIDDGSTDETARLIDEWAAGAPFPVRHERQENRGKHVAHNRAVRLARGRLFVVLDSDDACVPEALARMREHWDAIPASERDHFYGVTGLCVTPAGDVVGDRFPSDVFDSDSRACFFRYRITGEKWGCGRTDVLQQFPFDETLERTYVPESIVWFAIARRYRTRYVNEAWRIYHVDGPSLVHQVAATKNAAGRRLAYLDWLRNDTEFFRDAPHVFVGAAALYARFSWWCGVGWRAQRRELGRGLGAWLHLVASPLGAVLALKDRLAKVTAC